MRFSSVLQCRGTVARSRRRPREALGALSLHLSLHALCLPSARQRFPGASRVRRAQSGSVSRVLAGLRLQVGKKRKKSP